MLDDLSVIQQLACTPGQGVCAIPLSPSLSLLSYPVFSSASESKNLQTASSSSYDILSPFTSRIFNFEHTLTLASRRFYPIVNETICIIMASYASSALPTAIFFMIIHPPHLRSILPLVATPLQLIFQIASVISVYECARSLPASSGARPRARPIARFEPICEHLHDRPHHEHNPHWSAVLHAGSLASESPQVGLGFW